MVPVLDLGNPRNPVTKLGSVGVTYNIGTYEVTAGQYTAFLNAVAQQSDPNNLYNSSMGAPGGCGIIQSGSPGNYSYQIDPAHVNDFTNRPVNFVSFWDAARFANWLQHGQPTGVQEDSNSTEDGTYTLTADGISSNSIIRNDGASWAVASDNEWYKAAYYNPTTQTYNKYPTSSNNIPGRNLLDPAPGNNANYFGSGAFPIQSPYYTTIVGQFANSLSPYGTADQGGNVAEWTETIESSTDRRLRGGQYNAGAAYMSSTISDSDGAGNLDPYVGFRIVEVTPEPASMGILGLGVIGMLIRRKGARK